MKNKNGFTLIELLGVIAVLGIIIAIAIPAMSGLINKAGDSYYKSMEKSVKLAGIDYFTDNKNLLPSVGNDQKVNLKRLVDLNYIEDVKDKKENNCDYDKSYVIVEKEKHKDSKNIIYEYTSCLKCDDYKTSDSLCTYD